MAEAIHCPSCSTRYRLSAERVTPFIRRAKCASCGGVFPVGDLVQRLLTLPAPAKTAGFSLEDLDAIQQLAVAPAPTLDPSDLAGTEAEILEKTLVEAPAGLPETKADLPEPEPEPLPAPVSFPPEITETTLSGYTSARDAIEKLFAGAPAAQTPKGSADPAAMDMEATLSALESTLGGTLPTPPALPAGDSPTAAGVPEDQPEAEVEDEDHATSTLRLSQEDLAAMAAPRPTPAEPTVALRASDFLAAGPADSAPAAAPAPEAGSELLRLKIGEEIYGNLTMPQLITWVEEGRILENHLVARQHSEHWLEAHKVPGLRPVFERMRRERSGGAPSLDSGFGEIAPKKSLFGGLFGKNA